MPRKFSLSEESIHATPAKEIFAERHEKRSKQLVPERYYRTLSKNIRVSGDFTYRDVVRQLIGLTHYGFGKRYDNLLDLLRFARSEFFKTKTKSETDASDSNSMNQVMTSVKKKYNITGRNSQIDMLLVRLFISKWLHAYRVLLDQHAAQWDLESPSALHQEHIVTSTKKEVFKQLELFPKPRNRGDV